MGEVRIPLEEFKERVSRLQVQMEASELDAIITFGHSAEPQYLRYFSDFQVSFETGGVAIPATGGASLLVGPESLERAEFHNVLGSVKRLMAFREPAAPRYEDDKFDTFEALFAEFHAIKPLRRVGIAGWTLIPMHIYEEIRQAVAVVAPKAELVSADAVVDSLRSNKSQNELACIRRAAEISRQTMEFLLSNIRIGMTGEQVKGLALAKMYELGAEGEAFSMWITRQAETEFAISVPTKDRLEHGDLVQIQIGARYEGYASAVGRPVVIGRASEKVKHLIESCIKAKQATEKALDNGVGKSAALVAQAHREEVIRQGHEGWLVYGPCHGVGLVECEMPWIEQGADFLLEEDMAFCVDIFLADPETHRGVRFEDMIIVKRDGIEKITNFPNELIEIV